MRGTFKTHQTILVWVAITCLVCTAGAQVKQDVSAELSRAQAFYFSSQFQESLILLTELEKRIGTGAEQATDLLNTKLYMGLVYLGMNQEDQAKSKFVEVCKLDGKYALNPQVYSARIIAVFNEAKVACAPPPARDSVAAETSISQSTFLHGKELYEKGQFEDALKYFNVVLALDDKHDLAREYADLAQQRMEIATQRGYAEWRMNFDAHQYDKAAAAYAKIRTDQQPSAKEATKQIESEYQTALLNLVASWKAACNARELTRLDSIRIEATNIGAGLPFGPDALAQLQPCAPRTATPPVAPAGNKPVTPPTATASNSVRPPAATPNPAPPAPVPASAPVNPAVTQPQVDSDSRCIKGDPMLAMTRLKTRINPQIEPSLQRYMGRGVAVSIEIDEQGNVAVKEVVRANPRVAEAIKLAVSQWKFNPTIIDNQPRCVDTDLPIAAIQP